MKWFAKETPEQELKRWKVMYALVLFSFACFALMYVYELRVSHIAVLSAFAAGVESGADSMCEVLDAPEVDGYCVLGSGTVVESYSCPFAKLKISYEKHTTWSHRAYSWLATGCVLEEA